MKIQSVEPKLYTYKSTVASNLADKPVSSQTVPKEKDDSTKKKKILIGAGIAAVILLLVLFRKKIKNIFDGNGGRSGSNGRSGGAAPEGGNGTHGHGETPYTGAQRGNNVPKTSEVPRGSGSQKQDPTDYEALLKEYHERRLRQKDPYTLKTEEEKRLWMEEDEELRKMLHKLNEKNISLVIKEEFNPDPMIDRDKKKNYFYSWKVGHAMMNEASKMDYLEMFEKYGERYYDPSSPMNSSIANLGIASNEPTSDKILNKYIDVINKIAIKDPEGLNDAVWVAGTLNYTAEKMSEETILKFIDVLNRISYEQQEFFTTKYAIDRTIYKDSPRVKAALEDFEKTVQDLPYLFE